MSDPSLLQIIWKWWSCWDVCCWRHDLHNRHDPEQELRLTCFTREILRPVESMRCSLWLLSKKLLHQDRHPSIRKPSLTRITWEIPSHGIYEITLTHQPSSPLLLNNELTPFSTSHHHLYVLSTHHQPFVNLTVASFWLKLTSNSKIHGSLLDFDHCVPHMKHPDYTSTTTWQDQPGVALLTVEKKSGCFCHKTCHWRGDNME